MIHLAAVLIPDREELVVLAGSSPAGDPMRAAGQLPVSGPVKETVNVTVPVNTDASGQTVYLAGNLWAWAWASPTGRRTASR